MAESKSKLSRDNTMNVTAKEGVAYLKAEGKQTLLVEQGLVKPSIPRDNTMVNTAKEAATILAGNKPDADAQTRGQNKKLADISSEPPAKKTKKGPASKPAMKKLTSMQKTIAESKAVLGDSKLGDSSEGRQLRKRAAPPPKPVLKKTGTMQQTAKEGKAYLKRGRKPAAKKDAETNDDDDAENDAE